MMAPDRYLTKGTPMSETAAPALEFPKGLKPAQFVDQLAEALAEKLGGTRARAKLLLDRGWRPGGDPFAEDCRWTDPARPEKETSRRVRVPILRPNGTQAVDENKKPQYVEQVEVQMPGWPMRLDEAFATQLERDRSAGKK